MGKSVDESGNERGQADAKSWKLLEHVLLQGVREQRTARRWGVLFKGLTFVYLFALLAIALKLWPAGWSSEDDHVAVVRVSGVIAEGEQANAGAIGQGLREAFDSDAKAVILAINSPGGSPVQADQVFREVRRLRAASDKPVFAVISDLGASGAYYIAASADEVFADRASLVGSIGVISAGFGFVDLLEKLGLERRVFTAGSHKALLDAFTPIKEDEAQFWNGVLEQTHQQFVERVKEGRGQRLSDSDTVFSGLIWSGEEALELGLIDGFSSARELARARFDTETLLDYTPKRHPLQQMASTLGASVAETLYGRVLGGATPVLR